MAGTKLNVLAVCLAAGSMALVSCTRAYAAEGHAGPHWSYEGATGPAHWGDLNPKFATCKLGKKQSPIDIGATEKAQLPPVEFHYAATPLKIVNNGHTIEVTCAKGSTLKIGDTTYELLQFHFHTPSEHTVAGKPFDMEAHFVHKDAKGTLAVVGVFLEKGRPNAVIALVASFMPNVAGKEVEVPGLAVNAAHLLPFDKSQYAYSGSLTTPPCTEGVQWRVLKTPVTRGALAAVVSGLFFAGILVGGDAIQISLGLPAATVNIFNGVLLFFLIMGEYFMNNRVVLKR